MEAIEGLAGESDNEAVAKDDMASILALGLLPSTT
jgi:hypothetical protein